MPKNSHLEIRIFPALRITDPETLTPFQPCRPQAPNTHTHLAIPHNTGPWTQAHGDTQLSSPP